MTMRKKPAFFLSLAVLLALINSMNATDNSEEQIHFDQCVVGQDGKCEEKQDNENHCNDINSQCEFWSGLGECDKNPRYMLYQCAKSCNVCLKSKDDIEERIRELILVAEAEERQREILRINFGVKQRIHSQPGQKLWEEMKDYMNSEVLVEDRYQDIRYDCLNEEPECVEWAALGECAINKKWMTTNCAPACRTCHLLIYEERCPWKPSNETNIWKQPGDLSRMFKKIITSPQYQKYQVQVLSKPPEGPYVVALDGFLSLEEAQRLIELGGQRGYLQSMDVGDKRPDGTFEDYQNPLRTSTNAWCLEECYEDEATRTILARIEELTGVPDDYSEYLQLLKYEVGQKYGKHHDYIPHLVDRPEGVRIVTVFIYLNDVEGGGGTNFPLLNLTVFPKQGRVLIWPSVLDDDPNEKDERTEHQALPVEAGVKYGANAWLHNRDFKDPFSRGCS